MYACMIGMYDLRVFLNVCVLCMYISMYPCICMHVYMHVCMHVFTYACMRACMCASVAKACMHVTMQQYVDFGTGECALRETQ